MDDNEQAYLKVLMDEVFKSKNFVQMNCYNEPWRMIMEYCKTHDIFLFKTDNYELNGIKENKSFQWRIILGFEPRELRNRNILFNKENRPNLYYPFYINPKQKIKMGY